MPSFAQSGGRLKTFLVTGGAGFIGSNFVDKLLSAEHRVIVLDALTYAGMRENVSNRAQLVVGQIQDQQLVSELLRDHQVDAVVHFAAESHVDRSIAGPAAFVNTNVVGTFHLLESAMNYRQQLTGDKKNNFRFVQVSTDEVYGSLGDSGFFTEQSKYQPNSPYSASKASADLLARAWYHTYKLPLILTNCSNNYGPRQHPEKLIPHMIHCALSDRDLPVYGTGGNVRDWIHVHDHCHGVWLATEHGRPGESYLFGGGAERTNLSVVETLCRELDSKRPRADGRSYREQIKYVEDRKGHDWRYAVDDTKAQRELGFQRQYSSFELGLSQTVDWYLENQAWVQRARRREAENPASNSGASIGPLDGSVKAKNI